MCLKQEEDRNDSDASSTADSRTLLESDSRFVDLADRVNIGVMMDRRERGSLIESTRSILRRVRLEMPLLAAFPLHKLSNREFQYCIIHGAATS